MTISKVQAILVGNLFDERLQMWATVALPDGSNQTFSRWKITTDPDSGWTGWQQQAPDYDNIQLLAAALYATGQSQLFALQVGEFTQLVWRLKASRDSHSEWGPWMPFSPPWPRGPGFIRVLTAGVLGGQLSPYFGNAPALLCIAPNDTAGVAVIASSDSDLIAAPDTYYGFNQLQPWTPFQPQPPDQIVGIWPQYYGGGDITVNAPGTVPLWALGYEGTLYWTQATMLFDAGGNLSEGPDWRDWQPFVQLPSLPDGTAATVNAFATGVLSDGRIQLFACDDDGSLYTIWQNDAVTGAWLPGWTAFPQPGGHPVLLNNPDSVLWPNISTQLMSLTMGSLPDQRLQLFAVDSAGSVWSTWKTTTDPDAGWEPWSSF